MTLLKKAFALLLFTASIGLAVKGIIRKKNQNVQTKKNLKSRTEKGIASVEKKTQSISPQKLMIKKIKDAFKNAEYSEVITLLSKNKTQDPSLNRNERWNMLLFSNLSLKNYQKVTEIIREKMEKENNVPLKTETYNNLAAAFIGLQEYSKAEEILKKICTTKVNQKCTLNLITALQEQNKIEEALFLIKKTLSNKKFLAQNKSIDHLLKKKEKEIMLYQGHY